MINHDDVIKKNINKHNPNRPRIPDHSYRILIIRISGFGKTKTLLILIKKDDGDCSNLIKSIYTLRILMNQNIEILLNA